MRVRLLMDYGTYKRHEILHERDDKLAAMLVDLEIAELVTEAFNGTSIKQITHPAARMMRREKLQLRTK